MISVGRGVSAGGEQPRRAVSLLRVGALVAVLAGAASAQPRQAYAQAGPDTLTQKRNALGLLLSISGDGFGMGGIYRRTLNDDLYAFVTLGVHGSKDDREVERVDPFTGTTYVPGKLNRFIVVPMVFGLERRLFREEILDNFRPYLNVGVGPAMIYAAPYTDIIYNENGGVSEYRPVEFFNSLSRGQAHWTVTALIGAGAFFGSERSSLMGLHFSYSFTYLLEGGIPSLYDPSTGAVVGTKESFGGFSITLTIGTSY